MQTLDNPRAAPPGQPGTPAAAQGSGTAAHPAAGHALGEGWNDIPVTDWQGQPLDCTACPHAALRRVADGCAPGRSCMQDAYARRIDRFFLSHPQLAGQHLQHPYFEVRAIAARHADVFALPALLDDPDETVRMQLALRLPLRQLSRLRHDPHREVRIRVAQRLAEAELPTLLRDPDYEVRKTVARRLAPALLPLLMHDPDLQVRCEVARRVPMPALWRLVEDGAPEVRRIVAERLPAPLLDALARDSDWLVRHTTAGRALGPVLARLLHDDEAEVREAATERLALLEADGAATAVLSIAPLPRTAPETRHGRHQP